MSNASQTNTVSTGNFRRVLPKLVRDSQNNESPVSRPRRLWHYPRFWILFGFPNLAAITYFGLIASPIYVSHASLEVSGSGQSNDALSSLLTGNTQSSGNGAYVVQDFISTPDEFKRVNEHFDLKKIYGQYDFVSRFGSFGSLFSTTDVALWGNYRKATDVSISKSGIAQISVRAPSPKDAHDIALFVLQDTVDHIRDLNQRERDDYTSAAKSAVTDLEQSVSRDNIEMQEFRIENEFYFPDTYYTALMAQNTQLLIKRLDTSAKIAGLQGATPNSVAAQAFQSQLRIVDTMLADSRERMRRMSAASARFTELQTRHETDARLLGEARTALLQSTIKASQDHYYIHEIGYPSQLNGAEYPLRLLSILVVFVITSLLLAVARPTR